MPFVAPVVRTAAVDPRGRLWVSLTVPFTYVYDARRRQGAHRAVQRRRHHQPDEPVVHVQRSPAGHARLLRIRPGAITVTLPETAGARSRPPDASLRPAPRRRGRRRSRSRRGEIFALLGPNGAGKTTTLRMLAGLIEPSAGEVLLGGHRVARGNAARLRARVGFLTEAPGLWDRLTVTAEPADLRPAARPAAYPVRSSSGRWPPSASLIARTNRRRCCRKG